MIHYTKESLVSNNVRYGYFRVKTRGRDGYITMAMIRPPKDRSHNQYTVGISFCSPKDNFRKSLGRKVATGRLTVTKAEKLSNYLVEFESRENYLPKAFTTALEQAIKNGVVPSWAARAYKRGDVIFGLTANEKATAQKEAFG